MAKQISTQQELLQNAVDRILVAVEYYEMNHDTGEEESTEKNKAYVWKGYNRLMDYMKR